MKNFLRRLFFDIEPGIYAVFIICLFSMTGAVIIYLLPDAYSMIYSQPLFKWLSQNRSGHTFWLYAIVALFLFTGVTGVICLWRDIKKKRTAIAVYHICFLLVLLAHLVNSFYSFRATDNLIPQGVTRVIPLSQALPPLNIRLDNVTFDNIYGMPRNIKAHISYTEGGIGKKSVVSINHPVKINKAHVILKDLAPYMDSVTLQLSHNEKITPIKMRFNRPYNGNGYRMEFLAGNDDFSRIKILYEEGKKREILDVMPGSVLSIRNKVFRVERILPDILPAIVVDISYDPSLMLMLVASTIFVVVLCADAVIKIVSRQRA